MARQPGPQQGIVRLHYMAADPGHATPGTALLRRWEYRPTEPMLDGPVTRRVAIVDIDPADGRVRPGAAYVPPGPGRTMGSYRIADLQDPEAADFQQVSVFGAVMFMIAMFEEADVLGRPLTWAFAGQQLLVVPRAGTMANAFYHRDSRSLQFFSFAAEIGGRPTTVHTCLSPDIVAHETTHAILDGIAPDLYNASGPQALALHEAIADLGAVVFALRTPQLRLEVLETSGGDLRRFDAFNQIAEQFGSALSGESHPLRNLYNDVGLGDWGTRPASNGPHDLCLVLSGALYRLLIAGFEEARSRATRADGTLASPTGLLLYEATQKFKRVIFRGLDYLPPGEVAFADYARALIAADTRSNPGNPAARAFLTEEFLRRGIVDAADDLTPALPVIALPADLDLDLLVRSDWAAYRLAEALRDDLLIPPGIAFEVRPRLDLTKTTYRGDGPVPWRECVLRVAWRETEVCTHPDGLFDEISLTRGTTLVIDWQTRQVTAFLTTGTGHPSQQGSAARVSADQRRAFVAACFDDGTLDPGTRNVQIDGRTLRLRATAQMLHMAGH